MEKARQSRLADDLYVRLVDDEDARVCKDISEDACHYVPANFLRIVLSNILTQTGDALINPKTVLAWLINFAGAPAFILALLVPVRESGSLIPQLAIAAWVRRKPVRKWVWVLGSFLQGAAVMSMGITALALRGMSAGIALLIELVVFSLARGLCSVAYKDVLGKTMPKTRRGRVSGIASGLSGIVVVLVGAFMFFRRSDGAGPWFYALIMMIAAVMWWISALVFSSIWEEPGETSGGANAGATAVHSLGILVRDAQFRHFVITRALLITSGLVAPYYVTLAQRSSGGSTSVLGLLILAGGLASSLSAPTWGKMADLSSRRVLMVSATIAGGLGIAVFLIERTLGASAPNWSYPLAFFLLGIAHSGVRLGRKTYLIDMAGGNKRTDYVAVSNSVIGVILLIAGALTAALSFLPPEVLILGLALVSLLGVASAVRLPEVQTD